MCYKIGTGYDVHKLIKGRKLIIGGFDIPYEMGLEGHSDADVLVHSICDALLGAAKMGDIGKHFPDNDPKYKNANSLKLLKQVKLLIDKKYNICDIDSVIICQKPKLALFIDDMRNNIAKTLCLDIDCVGIKATTTEKLGFEGRGEGIAAQAVALLKKR